MAQEPLSLPSFLSPKKAIQVKDASAFKENQHRAAKMLSLITVHNYSPTILKNIFCRFLQHLKNVKVTQCLIG